MRKCFRNVKRIYFGRVVEKYDVLIYLRLNFAAVRKEFVSNAWVLIR